MKKTLSIFLVHYNTATLARECVASLRAQERTASNLGEVEIILVDNASRPEEQERLRDLEGVKMICNRENRGYAAAINQAYASSQGDFLLISNPDTWYFPGAVRALIEALLCLPRAGAVGPRVWWDKQKRFLLPPSQPMTLLEESLHCLASIRGEWQEERSRRWLRQALRYWQAESPRKVRALSGACILTTREVVERVGLFDERFHFYYEDTDWCRRVRQAGYLLYHVPQADVVHYYNQSGRQQEETAGWFARSAEEYFRKHYGFLGKLIRHALDHLKRQILPPASITDLGLVQRPPRLSHSGSVAGPFLLLLSPLPSFVPSIGGIIWELPYDLPSEVWKPLQEGAFYARLVSLPNLTPLVTWKWEKHEALPRREEGAKTCIRPYRSGDEEEITRLFHHVFGKAMSLEEWRWKYTGKGGRPRVFVGEAGGRIVCHYGGVPVRMSLLGKDLTGLAIVDSMAHPYYQGRGLFLRTARAFLAEFCGPPQASLIYGFPGERHRRLGELKIGYEPVARVYQLKKAIQGREEEERTTGVTVREEGEIPPEWDALWEELEGTFGLAVKRSCHYLTWRYCRRPGKDYTIFVAREFTTRVAGLAVLGCESDRGYLMEFLLRPQDRLTTHGLIAAIEQRCRTAGIWTIEGWFPPQSAGILVEMEGFRGVEADHYLECMLFDQQLTTRWLREHFYYSLGDYDVF
jgi:GT2 family glycosyltransferase